MGRVLPKPLHLQQQEQHGTSAGSTPLSPSSITFVLWLPNSDHQRKAGDQKQMGIQDRDQEDAHMQPANNRVLALGWARLQDLKQVRLCHTLSACTYGVHAIHIGSLAFC